MIQKTHILLSNLWFAISLLVAVILVVKLSVAPAKPLDISGPTTIPYSEINEDQKKTIASDTDTTSTKTSLIHKAVDTGIEDDNTIDTIETAITDKNILDMPKNATKMYPETLSDLTIYSGNTSYPLREYIVSTNPNDPLSNQWWESAINAPEAWEISTGSSDVTIAIIDTGFALQHEELVNRWHTNTGESGPSSAEASSRLNCSDRGLALNKNCNLVDDDFDGRVDNEYGYTTRENASQYNCSDQSIPLDKSCNLVDDDANGYADDVTGWDYINYDRSVQAGETNPDGEGTRHGTYVSAVAAGTSDNNQGIAGVNWTATILPIQAIDDDGYGNSLSVARAVNYAVAQGADVISMSLGGQYPDAYLRESLQSAIRNGVVIVAASGNDGCECISYPANYPEIIAVGALDYSMSNAYFSSYGANLDIMAPGVGFTTASWTQANNTNAYASGISGTSLATPVVSGALATIISQQPTASPLQLRAAILETANKSNLEIRTAHSNTYGFGALDLQAATERMVLSNGMNQQLVYSFAGLMHDTEVDAQSMYQCSIDTIGSSAILHLSKSGMQPIMTTSYSYSDSLQNNGYTSKLLGYACVMQPHDAPQEIRAINTAQELLGIFVKS